jgi:hypothetical protein
MNMGHSLTVPYVFARTGGYVVLYKRKDLGVELVQLANDGSAVTNPEPLTFVDTFDAARVGDMIIVATVKDTNRGDEAEPDMDRITILAIPLAGGPATEIFRLEKQTAGSPRVVLHANGGFTVIWTTSHRGRVQAQAFDAALRPVGGVGTSGWYGMDLRELTVARGASSTLALVRTRTPEASVDTIAALPRLDTMTFPALRPLANIERYDSAQLAVVEGNASFGYAWVQRGKLHVGTIEQDGTARGHFEMPVIDNAEYLVALTAMERGWGVIYTTSWTSGVDTRTWSLALDLHGRSLAAPQPLDKYPLHGVALEPTGASWFVTHNMPYDACVLEVGRLAGNGAVLDQRRCVVGG